MCFIQKISFEYILKKPTFKVGFLLIGKGVYFNSSKVISEKVFAFVKTIFLSNRTSETGLCETKKTFNSNVSDIFLTNSIIESIDSISILENISSKNKIFNDGNCNLINLIKYITIPKSTQVYMNFKYITKNKMVKTYCIYKVTNTINNKIYIGQTNNFKKRKASHIWSSFNKNKDYSCIFHNAIRKYGITNFKWEILIKIKDDDNLLNQLEQEKIITNKSHYINGHGYNMSYGGPTSRGVKHSKETRLKISNSNKGNRHSKKTKLKISKALKGKMVGAKNSMYGKKHSKETKVQYSLNRQGCKNNNFNKNVYCFQHPSYGEFKGTRYDFIQQYSLRQSCVSELINGNAKSHRKWVLIKTP